MCNALKKWSVHSTVLPVAKNTDQLQTWRINTRKRLVLVFYIKFLNEPKQAYPLLTTDLNKKM